MEIWAHQGRADPNSPGNTFLDFNRAYDLGVNGIETDVCFTAPDKDRKRELVIYHPNDDSTQPNDSCPKLDRFLEFLKNHPEILCCLELKENSERLLEAVVDKITEYELTDRVYLTACQIRIPFLKLEASARLLLKARARDPKIKTHLIAPFPFCLPALVLKYHPDIISVGWLPESKFSTWFFKKFIMRLVDLKGQIAWVRSRGIKIIGGIVNYDKDFEYLANLGVNGIMTDNSVAAMEFLKQKSP